MLLLYVGYLGSSSGLFIAARRIFCHRQKKAKQQYRFVFPARVEFALIMIFIVVILLFFEPQPGLGLLFCMERVK